MNPLRNPASGSVFAVGGVILITLAGVLGMLPGFGVLGRVQEQFIPMAPSTAVCFFALTLILCVQMRRPPERTGRLLCMAAAACIAGFGLFEAMEYFTGFNAGMEEIIFPASGTLNGIPLGRMSLATGLGFLLAGLSLLLFLRKKPVTLTEIYLPLVPAALTFLTGLLFLLAYFYGDPLMYRSGETIPMAMTTAAAFVLLGFAEMNLSGKVGRPVLLGLIFLCLAGGITAVGSLYYTGYKRSFRAEAEKQLLSIADLKVNELRRWRQERLADGEVLFQNPVFSRTVQRALREPENESARQELLIWLRKIQSGCDYSRILLLDASGKIRLSVPDRSDPPDYPAEHAAAVLSGGRVLFEDFHRHSPEGTVRLSVQVPLYEPGGAPLGVCVMQVDPHSYLYPFIQRWPVPSETAETLLIRREGDQVLFISRLRFNTNEVLTVHAPLTQTNLPAVQAVLGREGLFEGRDYRNKQVLSALRAVTGSPWFVVARRDIAEVDAPVRERLRQVVLMIGLLLLSAAATAGMFWRHERARHYREKAAMADALRASNRDLEQFAYVASHDLQEPLRMVANFMQLLERRYKDRLDQDANEFIAYAVDGAVRMQQMIDSLLSYSRLNTAKKPFEPVDLNAVLRRVLRDLEKRILEAGAQIRTEPLPHVTGDAIQLGLLLQNLISNALKFRTGKTPEIHVAAEEFSNHWKITVRDNGIGIEPEHQERIFKIFQRLHSRAEFPGTGIGLAVCRRIIERHGGKTGVESVFGKGSTFWFTLPKKGESQP